MSQQPSWKVLVVDDEEGIHSITRMIFRDYAFEGRPLELISAMSGEQARQILSQQTDIAVAILDVVMETDHEGLQLVNFIRRELDNPRLRIILRTGHPGFAPESEVVIQYDINDYLSKAELSASRLLTSVVVALRSYRDICQSQPPTARPETAAQAPSASLALEHLASLSPLAVQAAKRLSQQSLAPMVKDLAQQLHGLQQQLHHGIRLANNQPLEADLSAQSDLDLLLDQLSGNFLASARREGWIFSYQILGQTSALKGDSQGLGQCLMTALTLAKLRAKGGDIQLTARLEQQRWKLDFSSDSASQNDCEWSQQLAQQLNQQLTLYSGTIEQSGSKLLAIELPC